MWTGGTSIPAARSSGYSSGSSSSADVASALASLRSEPSWTPDNTWNEGPRLAPGHAARFDGTADDLDSQLAALTQLAASPAPTIGQLQQQQHAQFTSPRLPLHISQLSDSHPSASLMGDLSGDFSVLTQLSSAHPPPPPHRSRSSRTGAAHLHHTAAADAWSAEGSLMDDPTSTSSLSSPLHASGSNTLSSSSYSSSANAAAAAANPAESASHARSLYFRRELDRARTAIHGPQRSVPLSKLEMVDKRVRIAEIQNRIQSLKASHAAKKERVAAAFVQVRSAYSNFQQHNKEIVAQGVGVLKQMEKVHARIQMEDLARAEEELASPDAQSAASPLVAAAVNAYGPTHIGPNPQAVLHSFHTPDFPLQALAGQKETGRSTKPRRAAPVLSDIPLPAPPSLITKLADRALRHLESGHPMPAAEHALLMSSVAHAEERAKLKQQKVEAQAPQQGVRPDASPEQRARWVDEHVFHVVDPLKAKAHHFPATELPPSDADPAPQASSPSKPGSAFRALQEEKRRLQSYMVLHSQTWERKATESQASRIQEMQKEIESISRARSERRLRFERERTVALALAEKQHALLTVKNLEREENLARREYRRRIAKIFSLVETDALWSSDQGIQALEMLRSLRDSPPSVAAAITANTHWPAGQTRPLNQQEMDAQLAEARKGILDPDFDADDFVRKFGNKASFAEEQLRAAAAAAAKPKSGYGWRDNLWEEKEWSHQSDSSAATTERDGDENDALAKRIERRRAQAAAKDAWLGSEKERALIRSVDAKRSQQEQEELEQRLFSLAREQKIRDDEAARQVALEKSLAEAYTREARASRAEADNLAEHERSMQRAQKREAMAAAVAPSRSGANTARSDASAPNTQRGSEPATPAAAESGGSSLRERYAKSRELALTHRAVAAGSVATPLPAAEAATASGDSSARELALTTRAHQAANSRDTSSSHAAPTVASQWAQWADDQDDVPDFPPAVHNSPTLAPGATPAKGAPAPALNLSLARGDSNDSTLPFGTSRAPAGGGSVLASPSSLAHHDSRLLDSVRSDSNSTMPFAPSRHAGAGGMGSLSASPHASPRSKQSLDSTLPFEPSRRAVVTGGEDVAASAAAVASSSFQSSFSRQRAEHTDPDSDHKHVQDDSSGSGGGSVIHHEDDSSGSSVLQHHDRHAIEDVWNADSPTSNLLPSPESRAGPGVPPIPAGGLPGLQATSERSPPTSDRKSGRSDSSQPPVSTRSEKRVQFEQSALKPQDDDDEFDYSAASSSEQQPQQPLASPAGPGVPPLPAQGLPSLASSEDEPGSGGGEVEPSPSESSVRESARSPSSSIAFDIAPRTRGLAMAEPSPVSRASSNVAAIKVGSSSPPLQPAPSPSSQQSTPISGRPSPSPAAAKVLPPLGGAFRSRQGPRPPLPQKQRTSEKKKDSASSSQNDSTTPSAASSPVVAAQQAPSMIDPDGSLSARERSVEMLLTQPFEALPASVLDASPTSPLQPEHEVEDVAKRSVPTPAPTASASSAAARTTSPEAIEMTASAVQHAAASLSGSARPAGPNTSLSSIGPSSQHQLLSLDRSGAGGDSSLSFSLANESTLNQSATSTTSSRPALAPLIVGEGFGTATPAGIELDPFSPPRSGVSRGAVLPSLTPVASNASGLGSAAAAVLEPMEEDEFEELFSGIDDFGAESGVSSRGVSSRGGALSSRRQAPPLPQQSPALTPRHSGATASTVYVPNQSPVPLAHTEGASAAGAGAATSGPVRRRSSALARAGAMDFEDSDEEGDLDNFSVTPGEFFDAKSSSPP